MNFSILWCYYRHHYVKLLALKSSLHDRRPDAVTQFLHRDRSFMHAALFTESLSQDIKSPLKNLFTANKQGTLTLVVWANGRIKTYSTKTFLNQLAFINQILLAAWCSDERSSRFMKDLEERISFLFIFESK